MSPRIAAATVAEHKAAKLKSLLDACNEIAAAKGADAITLNAAAQRAGISRSSIYTYVENRDDLIRLWGTREMDLFLEQVDRAVDVDAASPAEVLRRLLAEIAVALSIRPQISDAAEASIDTRLKALMMEHLHPLMSRFDAVIARGVREGEFNADAAEFVPYLMACLEVERRAIRDGDSPAESARRLTRFALKSVT